MRGKHVLFRSLTLALFSLSILSAPRISGQQLNNLSAQLNVNGPITWTVAPPLGVQQPVLGFGPIATSAFLGSTQVVRVRGGAFQPVALVYGNLAIGAFSYGGNSIDIADDGALYANQILVSGFAGSPGAFTNAAGDFTMNPVLLCPGNSATSCATFLPTTATLQAVVGDASAAPFFVTASAACVVSVFGTQTLFALSAEQSTVYNFPSGFTFNFYGTNYTSCFVNANGFVSFGGVDNSFPVPTPFLVRSGPRRIMSFYDDLEPQIQASARGTRIYAHSFVDGGQTKVRIVHENCTEFADANGPVGGEMVLSQNGDIEIFIPPTCYEPFFNTVVGITPGQNIDPAVEPPPGQIDFGRDLSADVIAGPTPLGVNRAGFEIFYEFPTPAAHPLDLQGFGSTPGALYSSGIKFIRNPLVTGPNQAEYIIQ